MNKQKGIDKCFDALERLKAGYPTMPEYVGIEKHEITAAMVSVEAGFDKGYLKRSRPAHKPLIARIEALVKDHKSKNSSDRKRLEQAKKAKEKLKAENNRTQAIMDNVLTQNLMLLERVGELERELAKYKKR